MSFESRAGRAANSIHKSVASARPAGVGSITRRHRLSLATAVAFVGILAGASVAFATMLPGETIEDITATETTAATVTTTIPSDTNPPIVVLPTDEEIADGEGTPLPEGTAVMVLAVEDLNSLTGTSWDDWYFGMECWETTTTTTEPEEPTTTTKPTVTSITANQYYGPASSNPYEKIYGTAPPGTRILLTSEYGSSDGTVGSSGEYYLKVYFSGQPSGEYFPITATVGSQVFTFQFKWTGSYDVTANQYYGPENGERKDKVYGTAPPGTVVTATSDYGSSSLTVGDSGEYWLHIYFNETLPANEWITWTATLTDPSGTVLLTKTFDFKWVTGPVEVTASQYYGPVHDQRYDKVHGTAPPGTVVTTASDYGSSEMVVDASGSYYLKIYFNETLPADQLITWTATLKDPSGNVLLTKTFNFTYTPTYDITASQKWGPLYGEPTEKIFGTAPPGSEVSATSPFGSASMTVGGTGEYALVITFNAPTPNEAFTASPSPTWSTEQGSTPVCCALRGAAVRPGFNEGIGPGSRYADVS